MITNIELYLKNDWRSKNRIIHAQDITLNLSISLMSPYQKSNYYPKSLTPLCSLYRTNTHITGKFHLRAEDFLLSGSNIIKE